MPVMAALLFVLLNLSIKSEAQDLTLLDENDAGIH